MCHYQNEGKWATDEKDLRIAELEKQVARLTEEIRQLRENSKPETDCL